MQKVLILGCGYLGYNLAVSMFRDYSVSVAGLPNEYSQRLSTAYRKDEIPFWDLDLTKPQGLDTILPEGAIVINTTGSTNTAGSVENIVSDLPFYKLISELLLYLNTKQVSKFVQISSGGTVYGCPAEQPIKETTPTNPLTIYSLQKVFIEELLKINYLHNNSLPYCVLRVGNPYGGFQIRNKQQGAIPIFIRSMLKSQEITLWVDHDTVRDFIYISDFAAGVEVAMQHDASENVFNLATGVGTSIQQIIEMISGRLNQVPIIRESSHSNPPIPRNVLDIGKLRSIGFEPKVSILSGIQKEIDRIIEQE